MDESKALRQKLALRAELAENTKLAKNLRVGACPAVALAKADVFVAKNPVILFP